MKQLCRPFRQSANRKQCPPWDVPLEISRMTFCLDEVLPEPRLGVGHDKTFVKPSKTLQRFEYLLAMVAAACMLPVQASLSRACKILKPGAQLKTGCLK